MKLYAIAIAAAFMTFLTGCVVQQIVVDPIEQWEGHFYSIEDVQNAVQRMNMLNKGQSVWILSDSTLSRVLKNNRKRD